MKRESCSRAISLRSHRMVWSRCPTFLTPVAFVLIPSLSCFSFSTFIFPRPLLPPPLPPPTSPPPLPPSLQCSGWQMFGWLACHNNCGAGCLRWPALAVLWVLRSQDRTGQDISWGYGWRKEKWGYEQGERRNKERKQGISYIFLFVLHKIWTHAVATSQWKNRECAVHLTANQ